MITGKRWGTVFLLLFSFLVSSCYRYPVKLNPEDGENLFAYRVTLAESSLAGLKKQKGFLIGKEDLLRFRYRDGALDLPYDRILSVRHDEKMKRLLPGRPSSRFAKRTKVEDEPSFGEILTYLAGVVAVSVLYAVLSAEDYVYLEIDFQLNDQTDWLILQVKLDDFEALSPTLEKKIQA